MKPLFNEEEKKYIKRKYNKISSKELLDIINKKYNKNITIKQLRSWLSYNKIKSNINENPHSRLFNNEEEKYILEIYKGRTTDEITDLFNKKFNRNIKVSQIKAYKSHNKLKSKVDFKFMAGKKPHNFKPIGSEFTTYDNGIKTTYIKVGNPNTWEKKQKYLYKKYKGDVPKGASVIFLDGDRDNFELDNLYMLTKREKLMMCSTNSFFENKEMNKTSILVAKLRIKMKESKNVKNRS